MEHDDFRANELMLAFTEKGVGNRNPLWIASLALTFERIRNYVAAFDVYESNIQNTTSPFFIDKYKDFKERVEIKLKDNEVFDLGVLNDVSYKWINGNITATNRSGLNVAPEIDILSILNMKTAKQNTGEIIETKKKIQEKAAYDSTLIFKYGSFIEARLELTHQEPYKPIQLPKKTPASKRKPLSLISRSETKSETITAEDEFDNRSPILKSSLKPNTRKRVPLSTISRSTYDDEDENPESRPILKNRKPLQQLNSPKSLLNDEDDGNIESRPILKNRKPLQQINSPKPLLNDDDDLVPILKPKSNDKPVSILKPPNSPRNTNSPASRSVKIDTGKQKRTIFAIGDEFSAGTDIRLTVVDKKGEHSYICTCDADPEPFVLKINPMPSFLRNIQYKERFLLQDSHFQLYFITPLIKYNFSQVIDELRKRKFVDELLVVFFLFELNRILISLERLHCVHGNITIDNLLYNISSEVLPAFDDSFPWKETGLMLSNCDKIIESRGNDRKSVKAIICTLINGNPDNETIPKRWSEDFWINVFKTLSNPRQPLTNIESSSNAMLREQGTTLRSRVSRINVSLQESN